MLRRDIEQQSSQAATDVRNKGIEMHGPQPPGQYALAKEHFVPLISMLPSFGTIASGYELAWVLYPVLLARPSTPKRTLSSMRVLLNAISIASITSLTIRC